MNTMRYISKNNITSTGPVLTHKLKASSYFNCAGQLFHNWGVFNQDEPLPASYHNRPSKQRPRGGLSATQENRAKRIMFDHMGCGVSIKTVATECELSRSHFSRAFKKTMGCAPSEWLRHSRIARAKELLRNRKLSITYVGMECGFSDQSHFTRIFTTFTGMSPGKWRAQQACV